MLHAFGFKKNIMHACMIFYWNHCYVCPDRHGQSGCSRAPGWISKTSALGHLQAAAGRSVALVGPAMILQLLCLRWQLMDISTCPNTCTSNMQLFCSKQWGFNSDIESKSSTWPLRSHASCRSYRSSSGWSGSETYALRCPKAIDWSKYCFFKLQQHDLELPLIWVTRFQKKNIYTDRVKSIKIPAGIIFLVIMLFYVDDMPTAPQAGKLQVGWS